MNFLFIMLPLFSYSPLPHQREGRGAPMVRRGRVCRLFKRRTSPRHPPPSTSSGQALTPPAGAGGECENSNRRTRIFLSARGPTGRHNPRDGKQPPSGGATKYPQLSGTGNCYDNAPMESFFGTLKDELVPRHRYATREEARQSIADYIELYYNAERIHSALEYRTPIEWERHQSQNINNNTGL